MTIPYHEEEDTHKDRHQDEEVQEDDVLCITKLEIDPQQQQQQEANNNKNSTTLSEGARKKIQCRALILAGLVFVLLLIVPLVIRARSVRSDNVRSQQMQAEMQAQLSWLKEVIIAENASLASEFSTVEVTGADEVSVAGFTPQVLSLVWLAFGTFVDMATDRKSVVQRYVLGVLYFSLQTGEVEVQGEDDWTEAREEMYDILEGDDDWTKALEELHDSLEGEAELHSGMYLEPGDECAWRSKDGSNKSLNTCDSSGAITSIYFDATGMSGTIPAELSILRNSLSSIEIEGLNLQGSTIPTELGRLTQMQKFVLRGGSGGTNSKNDIEGETTVTTIPPVIGVRWSRLEHLHLVELDLHGRIPTELGQLTLLRQMDLSKNQLTGVIPTEFGNLTELNELTLYQNDLVGEVPTELGLLAELKSLSLLSNRLTGSLEFLCGGANVSADAVFHADMSLVDCSCCT